ncbi:hypothetical protein [Dactylosporangium darangshiense]|uniref:Uncharacterized protein n=1 Tax=Dactylosporangium darangshiense TaxID=579108 RepID=A0ABP8DFI6_9ACTN
MDHHSLESESDEYVARHSTIGSGAAGRATDGEIDETLEEERLSQWTPPDATPPESATTPPDMTEMPDPDGSHHKI